MTQRRWQPPSMKPDARPVKPEVKVDEGVVRKMLRVNPDLRKGRTTFQVKKALESGESILPKEPPKAAASPCSDAEAPSTTAAAAASRQSRDLEEAVGFFLRSKGQKLREQLSDIEARRRALDEEAERARSDLRDQLVSFIALLDEAAVAQHGPAALSKHRELLAEVGLSPRDIVERAAQTRSCR